MKSSQLRIQKVSLKNFRKYLGIQEVEFSTDSKKPVTVFHGISGKGKTSFLNALHWCIYGIERDNSKIQRNSDEGLVHSSIIEKMENGDEEEMYVEIWMEDDEGPVYKINRKIILKKNSQRGGEGFNETLDCTVPNSIDIVPALEYSVRNEDTGEMDSDDNISSNEFKMEKVFPKILSSYILFDSELLSTFQKDEQGDLVKKGMEEITGLPIVFETRKGIEKIKNKIRIESSGGNEVYQRMLTQQDRIDRDIEDFEEKIKKYDNDIKINTKTVAECTKILKDIDDETIKKNEELRGEIVDKISLIEGNLKEKLKKTQEMIFDNLYKFYVEKESKETIDNFDEYAKKGLFPTIFTKEQITKVLTDEKCLCGRPVTDKEEEIKKELKHMLSKVFDLQSSGELNDIRTRMVRDLNSIQGEERQKLSKDYKDNLFKIEKFREELKKEKLKKREIDEKLEETEVKQKESQEYGQKRTDAEKIIARSITQKAVDIEKLNSAKGAKKRNDKEIKKQDQIQVKDKIIKNRIKLTQIAIDKLTKLKNESLDDFRNMVEKSAQEYFLNTAPEKESFDGVQINDNFIIEAKTKDKTRKISQGQAHCLGLSYIAAIRDVTKHNYFMVIDSPFHNVSQESKLLICKELPTKMGVTQITFLVTDTEYKAEIPAEGKDKALPSVKEILNDNNLVWKRYDITKEDKDGIPYAKITEGVTN